MPAQRLSLLSHRLVSTGVIPLRRFVTSLGALVATAGANTFGVSQTATTAAGQELLVDCLGTSAVEAGAPIPAGSRLGVDASGRAVVYTAGAFVGYALQAATAAGDIVEVLLAVN